MIPHHIYRSLIITRPAFWNTKQKYKFPIIFGDCIVLLKYWIPTQWSPLIGPTVGPGHSSPFESGPPPKINIFFFTKYLLRDFILEVQNVFALINIIPDLLLPQNHFCPLLILSEGQQWSCISNVFFFHFCEPSFRILVNFFWFTDRSSPFTTWILVCHYDASSISCRPDGLFSNDSPHSPVQWHFFLPRRVTIIHSANRTPAIF